MHALSLKISDTLYQKIETEVSRRHITKSQLIRMALEKSLSVNLEDNDHPSFYSLSEDLCGSISGKMNDLSSDPKHMEGYGE